MQIVQKVSIQRLQRFACDRRLRIDLSIFRGVCIFARIDRLRSDGCGLNGYICDHIRIQRMNLKKKKKKRADAGAIRDF